MFSEKIVLLWDNVEEYVTAGEATEDNVILRVRFACSISKAKNTHSEYVTLIAFPLQQCLHERAWVLRYTYIACRDCFYNYFICQDFPVSCFFFVSGKYDCCSLVLVQTLCSESLNTRAAGGCWNMQNDFEATGGEFKVC